ncbi:conserved hypothetical protein [Nostocoides japonicum T1-X7]|uniref:Putative pterin-4-alpha-carbinolamine dehydratase n=1 Tax=Nostocoides japonicum T1-X7 TaxID=1194083 RepID=A0A077LTC0_9MICO|nr:4a-hydroxytetrahydrobiopterin dehydratase [Tetrasphaera japonica]CCH76401.1 conserved hypothetical protein [Tetrasphaera japonica T1-X7]
MSGLTTQEIIDAGLADWRKLPPALHARFRIPSFPAGAAFVAAVAEAAEAANHHPDLTLAYGRVDVAVCTHSAGHVVTQQDVDLARQISDLARQHGLEPRPTDVAVLELGLDTADNARIAPFWAALLTGDAGNIAGGEVFDAGGRVPTVWFQDTDEHDTPRQRWHPDLWLAPEVAEERIAAAIAAGGTLVDDSYAPSFWVLADPDGNKACICTFLDRDEG